MTEIMPRTIQDDALQTPPAPCSVCGHTFQPSDDLDFVCRDCQSALQGHCGCGDDDARMDWGVETEGDLPYFWVIECCCGRELRSRPHSLADIESTAKELHAEWMKGKTK